MLFAMYLFCLHLFRVSWQLSGQRAGLKRSRAWVQIAAATLSGISLRQTIHIHRASVHQAAKLVAALARVARVTAGLAESNGSLPPGLWLTLSAGWLPRNGICSGTLCSVIEYGLRFTLYLLKRKLKRSGLIFWSLAKAQHYFAYCILTRSQTKRLVLD